MPPPIPPLVPVGAEFEFGKSPFHVKGVLYQGTHSYFEKQLPGGIQALLDDLGPGPLRDFIGQKFLASARYDVMPVPQLIAHEARTSGLDLATYLRRRTRWQAEQDLTGVYRVLLQLASPARVITRLPRLLIQMFDFATVEFEDVAEGIHIARFSGVPEPLEEWLRIAFGIYVEAAIKLAGARDVDASFLDSEDQGMKAGLAIRGLRLRIVWT